LQAVDPIGYLSSDMQKGKKHSGWALIDLLDRAKPVNRFEVSSKEGGIDIIVVDKVARQPIVNGSRIKILTGRYENQSRLTKVVEGTGWHHADELHSSLFYCVVDVSAISEFSLLLRTVTPIHRLLADLSQMQMIMDLGL
jgi:hypothetical protein